MLRKKILKYKPMKDATVYINDNIGKKVVNKK
jgi:hypothetical protein